MTAVLVTGASGFVGRHAVTALAERGYSVHAVARRPLDDVPATWHALDLLDQSARHSIIETVAPTHLLHLAWETRHGLFWEAPENLDWVAATLDLTQRFCEAGGRRAVYAGSCAEYDWTPAGLGDGVCRERETPCRPATLYGLAKTTTRELVAKFAAAHDIRYAWGRLFLVYGPCESETRLVPSVTRALLEGREARLGDGKAVRDFLDARDAGEAFAALLASPVAGPVNIASGKPVAIADVAHRLARIAGRDDLLAFGALPARPGDPPRLIADVTRLRDEVGFTPGHDLDTGLAETVAWWRRTIATTGKSASGGG